MSRRWLVWTAAVVAVTMAAPALCRGEDRQGQGSDQNRVEGVSVVTFNPLLYVHPFNYVGWPFGVRYIYPYRDANVYISNYPADAVEAVRPSRTTRVSTFAVRPYGYVWPGWAQRQRIDDFLTPGTNTVRMSSYPPPENATSTGPANLEVPLPAEAELWVDGKKTSQTGATRKFSTPELKPGQDYAYGMRAESQDKDRKNTQTRQITFHAGEKVTVDFTKPPPAQKYGEELAMPKTK